MTYVLKEKGRATIIYDLCVFLDGVDAKVNELLGVREEDGSGSLLVVTAITRIEDFDADLALLVWLAGGDCEATLVTPYPEAPVPKSMAMTCVKSLSSFRRAIQILTYYISEDAPPQGSLLRKQTSSCQPSPKGLRGRPGAVPPEGL